MQACSNLCIIGLLNTKIFCSHSLFIHGGLHKLLILPPILANLGGEGGGDGVIGKKEVYSLVLIYELLTC